MKRIKFLFVLITLCLFQVKAQSQSLDRTLEAKDSLLFDAIFHTCTLSDIESIFSTGFEYYQDRGDGQKASVTARAEFMGNIKKRCARAGAGMPVRRSVSSLQAFPMGDAQALQTGIQRFFQLIPGKPDQLVELSRFSRIWVKTAGDWKMERELDNLQELPHDAGAIMKEDPLYTEISKQDSLLFNAFNRHNIVLFQSMFSKDLEFYQDRTGLTGYGWNMDNFKKHMEDSSLFVRRELVEGSLEVYPMAGYGALEIGVHRFYGMDHGQEKLQATAKFITLWQNKDGGWKITREISYDHQ